MCANKAPEIILRAATEYHKQIGTLSLLSQKLELTGADGFTPVEERVVVWTRSGAAPSEPPPVTFLVSEIKHQYVSAATTAAPQLKLSLGEGPTAPSFVFKFTSPRALFERDVFRDSIASVMPRPKKGQQSGTIAKTANVPAISQTEREAELEARQRTLLLGRDRELSKLYKELVEAGIISTSEFWQSRSSQLTAEKTRQQEQKVGFENSLLADLRPFIQTGNVVHYKLTRETISRVFSEFPAVKRAYENYVPDKMSEQDFWSQYLKSEYFHRIRAADSTKSTDLFSKCIREEEQDPQILKNKFLDDHLDPSLDISATFCDVNSDIHSVIPAPMKPKQLSQSIALIRRCNRHGALVINSADVTSFQPSTEEHAGPPLKKLRRPVFSEKEKSELTDLVGNRVNTGVPLSIQGQTRYFEGHGTNSSASTSSTVNIDSLRKYFKEQLHCAMERESNPTLNSENPPDNSAALLAIRQISEMTQETASIRQGTKYQMQPNQVEELRSVYAATNELLRHFWGSWPPTTDQQQGKVRRVASALESRKKVLLEKQASLGTSTNALLASVEKALDIYSKFANSKRRPFVTPTTTTQGSTSNTKNDPSIVYVS